MGEKGTLGSLMMRNSLLNGTGFKWSVSDPNQAFNEQTGQTAYYDEENQQWKDAATGKTVTGSASDPAFGRSPAGVMASDGGQPAEPGTSSAPEPSLEAANSPVGNETGDKAEDGAVKKTLDKALDKTLDKTLDKAITAVLSGAKDKERGESLCFVDLYWIRVTGSSSMNESKVLAALFGDNPDGKDLYHVGIKVQVPEGDQVPVYSIELTDYLESWREGTQRGQIKEGSYAGPARLQGLTGEAYGIRKWRNGRLEDESKPETRRMRVSEDGVAARRLLSLVSAVPANDYGNDEYGEPWTSNSVAAWLLEKAGLRPSAIEPPENGIAPGWAAGIEAAWRR